MWYLFGNIIRTWVHLRGLGLKVLGESCKAWGQEDHSQAQGSCWGPCVRGQHDGDVDDVEGQYERPSDGKAMTGTMVKALHETIFGPYEDHMRTT